MHVPAEQKASATQTGGLLKCAEVLGQLTLWRINMASKTMDRYAPTVFMYRHSPTGHDNTHAAFNTSA